MLQSSYPCASSGPEGPNLPPPPLGALGTAAHTQPTLPVIVSGLPPLRLSDLPPAQLPAACAARSSLPGAELCSEAAGS